MHYAGRRSTIGGETGTSKKERERERGREKGRESIELGYEMEKGGMILMENVRETNENEREEEKKRQRGQTLRRRKRGGKGGSKRKR